MQPTNNNSLATVTGGITIKVEFEDQRPPEEIRVRQVKIKEFDRYLACLDNEVALVCFLTDKSPEWCYSLKPESFEEIVTQGEELNSTDFFVRWTQRKQKRMDRLAPGEREKLMRLQLANS